VEYGGGMAGIFPEIGLFAGKSSPTHPLPFVALRVSFRAAPQYPNPEKARDACQ
jgi:hypothetical protein